MGPNHDEILEQQLTRIADALERLADHFDFRGTGAPLLEADEQKAAEPVRRRWWPGPGEGPTVEPGDGAGPPAPDRAR